MPLNLGKAYIMGITRLKRKARRNKQTAAKRNTNIKQLTAQPVIKNVDKDELIASFPKAEAPKKAKAKKEAPKADVVEETVEVAVEEVKAEAPKEEKPKAKKAAPKKKAVKKAAPAEEEKAAE